MRSNSQRYYVCELDDGTLALIPQWMSELSVCHNMKFVEKPLVSVSSLLELKLLLKK
jgi:hypothetical protein